MNTIYNEKQDKHSEMIKDLQNLPKIDTPENFEFNLMTRIKNKNFGNVEKDKPFFNWVKFLAPSAIVATAIILFFIFLPSSQQLDNPILYQTPKLDNKSTVNNSDAAEKQISNQILSKPNLNASSIDKALPANNSVQNISPRIPFGVSRSVSLDDYLHGGNNPRNLQSGNIVNSGSGSEPLDRFFIAENPDQNTLKKYRAQVDSLKKAQMKADSLKKAQKMP